MNKMNTGRVFLLAQSWLDRQLGKRIDLAFWGPVVLAVASVIAIWIGSSWPVYVAAGTTLIGTIVLWLAMSGYAEEYELDRLIRDTKALPSSDALPLLMQIEAALIRNGFRLPRVHYFDISTNAYARRTQLGLDDNDKSRAIARGRAFVASPVVGDVQADEKVTALLERLRCGKPTATGI